jgi:hypothetical protein
MKFQQAKLYYISVLFSLYAGLEYVFWTLYLAEEAADPTTSKR